jgi:Peptidase A4 family
VIAVSAAVVVATEAHSKVGSKPPPPAFPAIASGWAGYVSVGPNSSSITVEGNWTAPSIVGNCSADTDQQSFTWIGIGGWNSDYSIGQTGTEADCLFGTAYYYAWYEFWPLGSVDVPTIQLAPGDSIFAVATYSNGSFQLTIDDLSTDVSFNATTPYESANRTSAEWVVEAPIEPPYSAGVRYPMTDFGNVTFSDTRVDRGAGLVNSSVAGGLIQTYVRPSEISGGAVPSTLNGSEFTVSWSSPF